MVLSAKLKYYQLFMGRAHFFTKKKKTFSQDTSSGRSVPPGQDLKIFMLVLKLIPRPLLFKKRRGVNIAGMMSFLLTC